MKGVKKNGFYANTNQKKGGDTMSVVFKKPLSSGQKEEDYLILSDEEWKKLKRSEEEAGERAFRERKRFPDLLITERRF